MEADRPLDAVFAARAAEALGRIGQLVIESNGTWPWRASLWRYGKVPVFGYGPDLPAALARLAGLARVEIPDPVTPTRADRPP